MELKLDEWWKIALYGMEHTDANLFLTWKAGTGKSTLLRTFIAHTQKRVVVLAPTGVAALNAKGQTIHSFFKFSPKTTLQKIKARAKYLIGDPTYTELDSIVIDEISMVRADLFDYMDQFLRIVRGNNLPFGGVQMILIGDLFQLPPVVTRDEEEILKMNGYESPYFFSSKVMGKKKFKLFYHELEKIYRQTDEYFIDFLNKIREGEVNETMLQSFNQKVKETKVNLEPWDIYLAGKNAIVNQINQEKLDELETQERTYFATIKGAISESSYPTEAELTLKIGAQVMFVANDPAERRVNGTLGLVLKLEEEKIRVQIFWGDTVEVIPYNWKVSQYYYDDTKNKFETETVGSFNQVPLKLAWACTIHKSQGKTFDKVILDFTGGIFAHGQTYVALSRCKTLEGISMTRPLQMRDFIFDKQVLDFIQQAKQQTLTNTYFNSDC